MTSLSAIDEWEHDVRKESMAARATALGMSAGVGRLGAISGPIVGGTLLGAGLAYPWGFFAFAAVGALGSVAMVGSKTVGAPDRRVVVGGNDDAPAAS